MGVTRPQHDASAWRPLGHRLSRLTAAALLALGLFALPAAARQAVVTLESGQALEGDLTQQSEAAVTLVIAGIPRTIERQQIKSIDYPLTFDEDYARRAAAVAPGDLAAQYQLAYWLFENKAYALAEHELAVLVSQLDANAADPQTQPDTELVERASVLATAIEQRVKLLVDEQAVAPLPRDAAATTAADQPAGPDGVGLQPPLPAGRLSAEQINRIRLFEVDLQTKPKVRVDRVVWDELFSRYAEQAVTPRGRREQTRMRAAEGWEQLQLIFNLKAREFYDRVQVLEDPPSLWTFRTQIHQRYVLNYCGTAECHGGEVDTPATRPGQLTVLRLFPNRDDTVYTNFYRLHAARGADGEVIDRQAPARSLLIQYGLPADSAFTPHPTAPGWRAGLRDTSDPTYQLLQRWITQELYHPEPDYGLVPSAASDAPPSPSAVTPQP